MSGESGLSTTFWPIVKHSIEREPEYQSIVPYIDALNARHRLVIIFDGMDEMSREHYSEHTEALSKFAMSHEGEQKRSSRVVLQILVRSLFISGWRSAFQTAHKLPSIWETSKRLLKLPNHHRRHVMDLEAPREATGSRRATRRDEQSFHPPTALRSVEGKRRGPPRVSSFSSPTTKRPTGGKLVEAPHNELFPELDEAFLEWGRFAYTITTRDRGTTIPMDALHNGEAAQKIHVTDIIRVGKRCGVLEDN